MSIATPAVTFLFVGNQLALDFVNTVPVEGGAAAERLTRFADLVAWLEGAGALAPADARQALAAWDDTPVAADALRAARELRAAVHAAAEAHATGAPVPEAALRVINAVLDRPARRARVERLPAGPDPAQPGRGGEASGAQATASVPPPASPSAPRYVVRARLVPSAPADLLLPVAEAAAALLTGADPARVRRCAHPACVLYFLDTTKNGARRWCDMATCGNRTNAAAHYRRRRASQDLPSREPTA